MHGKKITKKGGRRGASKTHLGWCSLDGTKWVKKFNTLDTLEKERIAGQRKT